MNYVSSLFMEKIPNCEKLLKQVIHISYIVQKYLKSSTKIYHIEHKNILYLVPQYISDKVPKYIRLHLSKKLYIKLHTKIF
jgi:hypothetical protein